jgi:hypothetical protein
MSAPANTNERDAYIKRMENAVQQAALAISKLKAELLSARAENDSLKQRLELLERNDTVLKHSSVSKSLGVRSKT